MVTYSSILAWEIPWTGRPGKLQSMGLQRVGHTFVTEHEHLLIYIYIYTYTPNLIKQIPCGSISIISYFDQITLFPQISDYFGLNV